MSLFQTQSNPQAGGIFDPGSRDQFNILLWTTLAARILGLPSPAQTA